MENNSIVFTPSKLAIYYNEIWDYTPSNTFLYVALFNLRVYMPVPIKHSYVQKTFFTTIRTNRRSVDNVYWHLLSCIQVALFSTLIQHLLDYFWNISTIIFKLLGVLFLERATTVICFYIFQPIYHHIYIISNIIKHIGLSGRHHMIVGFKNTLAINAYRH